MWGLITGAVLLGIEALVYGGSIRIADALGIEHIVLSGTRLDSMIPVCPIFVFVYAAAYVFWVIAPVWIVREGRKRTIEFIASYLLTLIISGVIMTLFPTEMDRAAEGLLAGGTEGFAWSALHFIYSIDGGSTGTCLVPSLHCLVSFFYYSELKNIDSIKKENKTAVLVLVILIVISTMLTKQHFVYDCIAGILLGAICCRLIRPRIGKAHIFKEISDDNQ